jgi:hypothetical protein
LQLDMTCGKVWNHLRRISTPARSNEIESGQFGKRCDAAFGGLFQPVSRGIVPQKSHRMTWFQIKIDKSDIAFESN